MARVTRDGIESTSRSQYRARLEAAFQSAFGDDISLDSETPQGQMIGIFAQALSEVDDVIVSFGNATRLSTAYGDQLDSLGTLLQIPRLESTKSTVVVTFGGTSGETIDTGLTVNTNAGDLFTQVAPLTFGSDGSGTVTMDAREFGPVDVPNVLAQWQIRTPFSGLGITEIGAATEGRFSESDYAYRSRMRRTLAHNALGGLAALGAAVDGVDGVTRWRVAENPADATMTVDGLSALKHSVLVAVQGGDDGDIARAIANVKPLGVDTGFDANAVPGLVGATQETETVSGTTIRFVRITEVPVVVTLTITRRPDFPSDGIASIANAIVQEIGALDVGQGMETHELYRAAYSVGGHVVTGTPTIARKTARILGEVKPPANSATDRAAIAAISTKRLTITVGANSGRTSAITLNASDTYTEMAIAVQAALLAVSGVSGVTFTWDGDENRFVLTATDALGKLSFDDADTELRNALGFNPDDAVRNVEVDDDGVKFHELLTVARGDITIT